ncbi:hypothetical protein [Calidithermus roseus]|uniref:Uncharacterized protein n=1 Tax=Calidithermus roseus TaxID=1644118 RepID=A0A399EYX9_9DEIN|nr:hypothetical protein [Calidithermus roseus]RIH88973.1 hypothetical protein Mrose_00580 [Calidithermus roseus]
MASGLKPQNGTLYHWDIYALFYAPQEVYFGHETQVNLNLIETVNLPDGTERVYLSPTKRRGVERRALLYASAQKNGQSLFLTDLLDCGIPNTCGREVCPICRVYGALVTEKRGDIERTTFIGRLTHGGGVAVPPLEPLEKQRAMHPSDLRREAGEEPQPFKRQYGAPGLLFPVYNHVLSATEAEFRAAAYAFLESLHRLGAGNPKGLDLFEDEDFGPYLVLDRYRAPLGRRVILPPTLKEPQQALEEFRRRAGDTPNESGEGPLFERRKGKAALEELRRLARAFVEEDLPALAQG